MIMSEAGRKMEKKHDRRKITSPPCSKLTSMARDSGEMGKQS